MRLLALPACLLLSACVGVPQAALSDDAAPAFPVTRFFDGRTQGEGQLRLPLGRVRTVQVNSTGAIAPDGSITVSQRIAIAGRPPATRAWRLREVAPGRYAGTLTDAAGPVTGEVRGNRLLLRFPMSGGLAAEQHLTLARDGRSAHNVMVIRKFGLPVAALEETIRRID